MARHSELVKIPRIDRYVSKLALGSAPLGGLFSEVTDLEAEETILAAVNSGINFFDTASLYGHGNADIRVGSALKKSQKPFPYS